LELLGLGLQGGVGGFKLGEARVGGGVADLLEVDELGVALGEALAGGGQLGGEVGEGGVLFADEGLEVSGGGLGGELVLEVLHLRVALGEDGAELGGDGFKLGLLSGDGGALSLGGFVLLDEGLQGGGEVLSLGVDLLNQGLELLVLVGEASDVLLEGVGGLDELIDLVEEHREELARLSGVGLDGGEALLRGVNAARDGGGGWLGHGRVAPGFRVFKWGGRGGV
jgi:hypothetical protein